MLLAQATEFFVEKGMDLIICFAQNPFLPKPLYRKYGYIKNPISGTNFTICPLEADLGTHDLTAKENWLVILGMIGTM